MHPRKHFFCMAARALRLPPAKGAAAAAPGGCESRPNRHPGDAASPSIQTPMSSRHPPRAGWPPRSGRCARRPRCLRLPAGRVRRATQSRNLTHRHAALPLPDTPPPPTPPPPPPPPPPTPPPPQTTLSRGRPLATQPQPMAADGGAFGHRFAGVAAPTPPPSMPAAADMEWMADPSAGPRRLGKQPLLSTGLAEACHPAPPSRLRPRRRRAPAAPPTWARRGRRAAPSALTPTPAARPPP